MSPQEYGNLTGQHEQRRQQAGLFSTTRIDAYYGCMHPPTEDWLRDTVDAFFTHADRIEIDTWSFPAEEPEVPEPSAEDLAEYYREIAAEI